jgi:mycothiol synthase
MHPSNKRQPQMIDYENSPAIPGLKFRPFRGADDYASIAAVLVASENADQQERQVTADDIANAYQHLSNCDPYRDIIFAEVAGEMIGYSRGWWSDESSPVRTFIHNAFLVPEWRHKGIGSAMLGWMERRLREVASTHPLELEKVYQVNTTQFQHGTAALIKKAGYQPVRHYSLMVRPNLEHIPDLPLPEGVEVRPVLPEHYRRIWQLVVETSLDEWGHNIPTEEDYHEWLTSDNFQPDLWQVAWDAASDQVIGQVLTFIQHDENKQFNRRRGYTEGIGVSRNWRKHGIASALINRSLLAQKTAGMTESGLVVDTENPSGATHLYETCGFQIVKQDTLYRKPMDV